MRACAPNFAPMPHSFSARAPLGAENQRLRAMAQLRERAVESVVTARLVSSSASSTRRFANLNAGYRQGVRPGQPVRGPDGLVGQVMESSPNTARILLLIDAESVVPVQRTRDGLAAIVVGRGDGLLEVRSASVSNAALLAGDNFVTSGIGGIYSPGIPVVRVLRNARDIALARPFANPDSLDFALVQKAYVPELARPDTIPAPAAATPP